MEIIKPDWKKYTISFLITVLIFITALGLSNYFSNKRIANVRDMERKISTDILSSETQYDLLAESSCENIAQGTLTDELNNLGQRLTSEEQSLTTGKNELTQLKTYYSLLQIKDYLLTEKIVEKCDRNNVSILYFYNKNCSDCNEQGYVLTFLREKYPELRVYSFDMSLNNPALQTLASIAKVNGKYPTLFINKKTYNGLLNSADIIKILPKWLTAASTSTVTTSTEKKK